MKHYIDKSALVAEIERRIEMTKMLRVTEEIRNARIYAFTKILSFLDTLEVNEVDLEKEINLWIEDNTCRGYCSANIRETAEHFFELGLNSQTKDMQEALRMEYEKGRADVLRVIDPDEMVADFCSQPLSKTRSLASIYRQGISDILKRINRNEKTSITSTRSIDDGGVR